MCEIYLKLTIHDIINAVLSVSILLSTTMFFVDLDQVNAGSDSYDSANLITIKFIFRIGSESLSHYLEKIHDIICVGQSLYYLRYQFLLLF